jgi:hypothetical protein
MPGPSSTVSIRPLHPSGPNVLHMPTAGSTVQLVATAFDSSGLIVSTSFTWSSDNTGVATVNSSGLVTGVANGICNIQAQANDSGAAKGSIAVGTALLSVNSMTIAYGQLVKRCARSRTGLCRDNCQRVRCEFSEPHRLESRTNRDNRYPGLPRSD